MMSDTSGKIMEMVRQAQESCSTEFRNVLALASTALCVWRGVAGVRSVQMDMSEGQVEELRGKMAGWLYLTRSGIVRLLTLKLCL